MQRITIYDTDEYGEHYRVGHFDLDAAEHILEEDDRWNGHNRIGTVSGMQIGRAQLYRTAGGRWVEHADHSPEFNGPDIWRFLTDDQSREWMLKSGGSEAEEALARWFPDTPEESGPSLGGRPAVGPKVETRLSEETIARVDARAAQEGVKRAEMLRRLIEAAL